MLRKRSRSTQKDQNMVHDPASESFFRTNSFFTVPGLFVGLSSKGISDYCDSSVRSPTSPLDFRGFSNLSPSFRSPKSPQQDRQQKSWDSSKVGLSMVDSLDNDTKLSGGSSESKNIISLTSVLRHELTFVGTAKSLPKNHAISPHTLEKSPNLGDGNSKSLFEIGGKTLVPEPFGSCSLDSGRSLSSRASFDGNKTNLSSEKFCLENRTTSQVRCSSPKSLGGSPNFGNFGQTSPISIDSSRAETLIGPISASEIETSEDYTCVISHGPNPKTTHIFGDCILEYHSNELTNEKAVRSFSYSSNGFLGFCDSCRKKLDGKDIYMFRGEKAFCSLSCRAPEILIDEELENTIDAHAPSGNGPKSHSQKCNSFSIARESCLSSSFSRP